MALDTLSLSRSFLICQPLLWPENPALRRCHIARALGNTGDPKSLPVLEKALQTETDPTAQGEMRGAIRKLGGKP